MHAVSDDAIRSIRDIAEAQKDVGTVERCDKALGGDVRARGELAKLSGDGMIGRDGLDRLSEIERAAASDFG